MSLDQPNKLILGVKVVNEAHQELHQIIQDSSDLAQRVRVLGSMSCNDLSVSGRELLNRALEYTISHFTEEEIMQAQLHPIAYSEHKKAHRQLEKRLVEYYLRFDGPEHLYIFPELTKTLMSWWQDHILLSDHSNMVCEAYRKAS